MVARIVRPKVGQIVRLLQYDPHIMAEVESLLSIQFTAIIVMEGGVEVICYHFYSDYKETWV